MSMQEPLPSKIECSPRQINRKCNHSATQHKTHDCRCCLAKQQDWIAEQLAWCCGAVCEPLGGPAAPSWDLCPSSGWPHSAHRSLHLPLHLMLHLLHDVLLCDDEHDSEGPTLSQISQNGLSGQSAKGGASRDMPIEGDMQISEQKRVRTATFHSQHWHSASQCG